MLQLRKIFIFFYFICSASLVFASAQFASAEHIIIGDNVKLYFNADDPGTSGLLLQLPNGLNLTYGDIIAFGDLYGIVGQPISKGQTESERKARFLASFNMFATDPAVIQEATKLLDVMHNERQLLEAGLQNGEAPEAIYAAMGDQTNRQYNCITGGGCDSYWWLNPGRYLKLAFDNFDHFGNNAWIAYQTGHELAIETAILAHETHDKQTLVLAYALNAFASHFLTDRFAAGHIRTPRLELAEQVTPNIIGNILASFMHNEENPAGIHVHNDRGDHWLAFGDASYFNLQNATHRILIDEAVQTSVNEIFNAYLSGAIPESNTLPLLIPFADEINNKAKNDISSLFYWDAQSGNLMRRKDLANEFDRNWTRYWWGWSTLIELSKIKGLPTLAQAQLALSDYADKAVHDGLITDKVIINYVNKKSLYRLGDASLPQHDNKQASFFDLQSRSLESSDY